MSKFVWSKDKDELLKKTRNISFENVVSAIAEENLLSIEANRSKNHEGQKILIVLINDYPYVIPFDELDNGDIILRTIYPSRKEKKRINNENEKKKRNKAR
ncbi:MAG: toxin [Oligoflexia bacterium]|nr:toxin [Oligoflexia bacterium]